MKEAADPGGRPKVRGNQILNYGLERSVLMAMIFLEDEVYFCFCVRGTDLLQHLDDII